MAAHMLPHMLPTKRRKLFALSANKVDPRPPTGSLSLGSIPGRQGRLQMRTRERQVLYQEDK